MRAVSSPSRKNCNISAALLPARAVAWLRWIRVALLHLAERKKNPDNSTVQRERTLQ
jgi:hypothetical protein